MSSPILLSVCIPTYNRARLLEQSLRAVLVQITPALAGSVEVVVLDNASSDSTPAVVAQAQSEFPGADLRSVRRAQNIGPDANFCDAPTQTRGLFLYLLSDDDILLPGAISRLLELIGLHPNLDAFALNVRSFRESPDEASTTVYSLAEDCVLPERDAALLFLSTHITFLSCIAFRRENVLGRDYRLYFATHLAQAYMFLDALAPGGGLYAAKQTYLAQRLDNNQGYNFFEVFVSNFAALMQYAVRAGYSPAAVQTALRQHLKYIYHMLLLFKYRGSFGSIRADYADAFRRLWQVYRLNRFVFLVLVPIMVSPAILFPPLQRLYQSIKTRRQARPSPLPPSTGIGRVGIVLVNYNGANFLPECLQTLCANAYPDWQVVLVDNGSTDGSLEWVQENFSQVTTLTLGSNRGFTGGCNAGIAWCRDNQCDYVLLLNNDTTVAPHFLNCLMDYAGPDRLLAPKIYFYDDQSRINNHLGSYDLWRGIHRDLFYGKPDTEASHRTQDVTMANGCALLIPISVFEKIGLMDETFFLYAEDVDFIARAVNAGFRVTFVPDAVVYHRESASSGGHGSPLTVYYTTRNRLYLMHKHQKNRLIFVFFLVYFTATRLVVAARYLAWGQRPQLRALLAGTADYCRGRMGQAPPERYQ